jgi:signal transduction histidine kinase
MTLIAVPRNVSERSSEPSELELQSLNADLIAQKAKLEEQNESLSMFDKMKDQFLASTTHELKTPLNGIIGLTDILISGAAGALPKPAVDLLSTIFSSAKRLSSLVDDILDTAKLNNNAGKKDGSDLSIKNVDLYQVANEVLSICRPLIAPQKSVDLLNGLSDSQFIVQADEHRLQQILINLFGNAIKFTENGWVRLDAAVYRDDPTMIAVRVSDTGIGIHQKYHRLIFESFFQGDDSIATKFGGTGLGLSVTKRLVELHSGRIWVESDVNKGAVFTFTIPMASTMPDSPPANSNSSKGSSSSSSERANIADTFGGRQWIDTPQSAIGSEWNVGPNSGFPTTSPFARSASSQSPNEPTEELGRSASATGSATAGRRSRGHPEENAANTKAESTDATIDRTVALLKNMKDGLVTTFHRLRPWTLRPCPPAPASP